MKRKPSAERATAAAEGPILTSRVGRLLEGSAAGKLKVDFPGNRAGPLRARSTVLFDAATLARVLAGKGGVLLLFENGDPALPVIIGLIEDSAGGALLGELLARPAAPARPAPVEARLDGKRVVLEGKEEVVLRCGEASITLRRDGKVMVRGVYVETQAKGVNRIKGGAVKIN